MSELDAIDRQILTELQRDGSLSIAELAERLNMTAPPCWRRVRKLKADGVLKRQVWEVDAEKIGLGITLYATVKLATHDAAATTAFREEIARIPEVTECYILLGSVDALLRISVPSMRHYEQLFYNRLSQVSGVRELHSSQVMSEVVRTLALPLL
jgi:Lrp/AsnC family transcriptional regulator